MFDLGRERRRLRMGTRAFAREVSCGQARIFVDHGFQWDGTRNVWLTRARGAFVMQAGPVFDIRPRGFLSRVTGFQAGTPSGDPCFDDFFSVKTANPDDTWSALTTRVRSLLARTLEDARLLSDGHMVTIWREADFGRELDAEAAIEVVSEITHYGSDTLNALNRLPTAIPFAASGSWDQRTGPGVLLRLPAPVRIGPEQGERGPIMVARADCGRAIERFHVAVDLCGRARGHANRLPGGFAEELPGLGESSIMCDGESVALRWTRLETDRLRLLAGARLIAALASMSDQGLYR